MSHLARDRLPVIVDRTGDRSILLRLGFNLLSDFLAFEFDIDVDWGREEVRRHPEYDTSVDGQVGPTRGSVSSHTSLGVSLPRVNVTCNTVLYASYTLWSEIAEILLLYTFEDF